MFPGFCKAQVLKSFKFRAFRAQCFKASAIVWYICRFSVQGLGVWLELRAAPNPKTLNLEFRKASSYAGMQKSLCLSTADKVSLLR